MGGIPKTLEGINCVLGSWAKSFRNDTIENTEMILYEMGEHGIFPDTLSFFYIFKAYSKSPHMSDQQISTMYGHFQTCVCSKLVDTKVFAAFIGAIHQELIFKSLDEKKTVIKKIIWNAHSCGDHVFNDVKRDKFPNTSKVTYLSRISSLLDLTLDESRDLIVHTIRSGK